MSVYDFTDIQPTDENYWRGIVLFGRNVASYKFALAKTLLELAQDQREVVSLQELAVPYSSHLSEHLRLADRQATSASSRYLDACRAFNRGESSEEELVDITAKLGFQNVIDAFHVVGNGPISIRFFEDERRLSTQGIRLTDELLNLPEAVEGEDLLIEAEARWRLVETAWELNLPRQVLTVTYKPETKLLLPADLTRRKAITAARDALNGYQNGS